MISHFPFVTFKTPERKPPCVEGLSTLCWAIQTEPCIRQEQPNVHCSCQKTPFSGSLNSTERGVNRVAEVMLCKKMTLRVFALCLFSLNDFQIKCAVWCQKMTVQDSSLRQIRYLASLFLSSGCISCPGMIVGLFGIALAPVGIGSYVST